MLLNKNYVTNFKGFVWYLFNVMTDLRKILCQSIQNILEIKYSVKSLKIGEFV